MSENKVFLKVKLIKGHTHVDLTIKRDISLPTKRQKTPAEADMAGLAQPH